ncbi:VOC family protein [Methylocapsa sp. S129]|uniref:VOC family protein n=1 Tax=Methylocapsa sp. S129 TaxID=1641869 RepID=UPI00131C08B4|nr:VOC family protein [Methylocapsa sp. S129]
MKQNIGYVTFLVPDYDEAIAWFTQVLNFALVEDTALRHGKRWVLVAPPGSGGTLLVLAEPADEQQAARIGDQTGGRVFLFLHTDDFWRDHAAMKNKGVRFLEIPRNEAYGWVAVFEDNWGNRWDLLQLAEKSH